MKQATHWAQMEERGVIWGMRFLLRVYQLFGRTVLQVFLYPVVVYYWLINREARQASRAYLDRLAAFAPGLGLHGSLYWSYRHFISFANSIIDKLTAWSGALSPDDVVYSGRDQVLAELKKGRGLLLLSAHLGNLEVCRAIADFDKSIRINVLVHTKHAPKFNRLLNRTNHNSRMNILQVTDITAASAQMLYDKIESGELVIMAADRVPINNWQRTGTANFLGANAVFPQGPFILAGLLKCPVFTLICLKQQNKFSIYFDHFSSGVQFRKHQREELIKQLIQEFATRLENYCLQEPLQWFNFFDFWQDAYSAPK